MAPNLMRLQAFLSKNVEGYLLSDIGSLKRTTPLAGNADGAVGYPLLMTVFAGIELLGNLVSTSKFDPTLGASRFGEFWTQYLYPSNSARGAAGLVLYRLARHGLAHAFVVKGDLHVEKGAPHMHLVRTPTGGLSVDPVALADDFRAAYFTKVKPATACPSALSQRMASRLDEIEDQYSAQAKAQLATLSLPPAPAPGTGVTSTTAPTATLPAFPTSYKSTP